MSIIRLSIIFFSILLCSCAGTGINTTVSYSNEEIDPEIKTEVDELVKILNQAIAENNADLLSEIMSDDLKEVVKKDIPKIIDAMNWASQDKELTVMDEYYVQSGSTGQTLNLFSSLNSTGGNEYQMHFTSPNTETYAVLQTTNGGHNEVMICAIFGKYDDGWRLNVLQSGRFQIHGKTAPEHYAMAKEYQQSNELHEAYFSMSLAMLCLKPANDYFQYNLYSDINDYNKTVLNDFKLQYGFPFPVDYVASQPDIHAISLIQVSDDFYPFVEYQSKIELIDTAMLKIENDSIHARIDKFFPGLTKKGYIIYHAYNELPDGVNSVKRYGFVHGPKEQ